MKITRKILLLALLGISSFSYGQQEQDSMEKVIRGRNCINLDLPLDARIYLPYTSIGYERILFNRLHYFITGKIAIDVAGVGNSFSYNVGRKRNYFELGVGHHLGFSPIFLRLEPSISYSGVYILNNKYFFYPIVGYRFQPLKKGLVLGVYFRPTCVTQAAYSGTPITGQTYTYSKIIHSWLAFKLGFSF
ncbi:MAG: hypothetical protein ACKVTZ_05725 [Bacteroidia bacterium]